MSMQSYIWIFIAVLFLAFNQEVRAQTACQPPVTPIKYQLQKGEFLAAVLRKFKLEPVFGKNKSLEQTLAINKFKNANAIEPGAVIYLPFKCEVDLEKWTLTANEPSAGAAETEKFRWISAVASTQAEKVDSVPIPVVPTVPAPVDPAAVTAVAAAPEVVAGSEKMDARLKEVLGVKPTDPNAPKPEQKDIEDQKSNQPPEVSEALRYRMICEGEWVGDQCISRYSILHASMAGWFNRYDGIDPSVANNNRGVLLTKMNPEVMIGWENYWLPNVKTLLNGSIQYSELLPEAREVPIDQKKNYLAHFVAEARYENANWGVGLGYALREKLFYRFRFSGLSQPCLGGGAGFTGCGVTANAASVSSYFATVNWIFYQAGKFTNDITASLAYLGASDTAGWSINSGTGWWLEYRVKHDRIKEYLWASIRYGQQTQTTSIERQDATELGFTFGWAWKLKDW